VTQVQPQSFLGRLAQGELPRRLLGAVLSVLVPGAGHVVLGYSRVGWIVAAFSLLLGGVAVGCAIYAATTAFLVFGAMYILGTVASVLSIFALPRGPKLKEGLFALWPVLILFLVFRGAAYLVKTYAFDAYRVPSHTAMLPLLSVDDIVFVSPRASHVRVGDVVLVDQPDGKSRTLLRVAALGGQRVRFAAGGTLYVDGQPATDTADGTISPRPDDHEGKPKPEAPVPRYLETRGALRYPIVARAKDREAEVAERTLGPDEVYLLGDDRDNLVDSRTIGPVPRARLHGEALFVFAAGPYLGGVDRIWTRLSAAPR
jgi:signal peptidase I